MKPPQVVSMKYEEIDEYYRHKYLETCSCGNWLVVCTQLDDSAEYMTLVFVKCSCGEYVAFNLPVN